MDELLKADLQRRGWQSGTYRGFLRSLRGGIEWEVGIGRSGRLELRWRYRTSAGTDRDGEEALPPDATRATIEDVMTAVYLRVHERPDPTRVFGGGKRPQSPPSVTPKPNTQHATPNTTSDTSPEDSGQRMLDL